MCMVWSRVYIFMNFQAGIQYSFACSGRRCFLLIGQASGPPMVYVYRPFVFLCMTFIFLPAVIGIYWLKASLLVLHACSAARDRGPAREDKGRCRFCVASFRYSDIQIFRYSNIRSVIQMFRYSDIERKRSIC